MEIFLSAVGGLGLFIYGMNLMSDSLKIAAGSELKSIIKRLTTNRIMGVIVGALVTMIIQSSSATTVMVVGFVNAGMMDLSQAVGVIMGANLGTTITSQLIAFDLTAYAPIAISLGVILHMVSKTNKRKHQANIMIGFGILFLGMGLLSSGLAPLAETKAFADLMVRLENPFLAMLMGFVLTTSVQSSSAAIGILQALANQGLLGINVALPILFGDNIGTTTTSLISSIGANSTAKRAAFLHFIFNLIGTIIFMTVLRIPVQKLVLAISPDSPMRQIANAHTIFNLVNVIIQLPFANLLVKLVEKIVPEQDQEEKASKYLEVRFLQTPSIALDQVKDELIDLTKLAVTSIEYSELLVTTRKNQFVDKIFDLEDEINQIYKELTEYVVMLSSENLTDEEYWYATNYINAASDVELVADISKNIANLALENLDSIEYSNEAIGELTNLFFETVQSLNTTIEVIDKEKSRDIKEVERLRVSIANLESKYRAHHMDRLNNKECNIQAGFEFIEILSNLEKISKHNEDIAKYFRKVRPVLDRGTLSV